MASACDDSPDFMRPNPIACITRPGAEYFEDSDTDDDDTESVNGDSETDTIQLPSAHITQREISKAGYLYKQGGMNNDKGWKKRWMVFDGEMLRYFANNKTPVSLRIIPVSEMESVESVADGRAGSRSSASLISSSSRQYQFKVICKHRTFLFGTDNPDNRINWTSLIMAAILNRKKAIEESNNPYTGGDGKVELKGCARFDGKKNRYYMALTAGKLYYYYNEKDFEYNFAVHALNMEITNVQEIDGKLQLKSPPNQVFILTFDNAEETQRWKIALETAIAHVLGDDEILNHVRGIPGNDMCADCGADEPEWASINIGVTLCDVCAGLHRSLGVDVSKVRSLRMDKIFSERSSLLKMFEKIGNKNANKFWCKELQDCDKISHDSTIDARKHYIHRKYRQKAFCDHQYFSDSTENLNGALFKAVMTLNIQLVMKILMSGADVHGTLGNDSDMTAYYLAKESGDQEIAEYLYQNGGNGEYREGNIKDQRNGAKRDEDVYLDGYLEKTGPRLKVFNKRKCILEDGKLKYFKNNTLKGTIYMTDIRDITCIGTFQKRLYCFDIICNCVGGTRTYRFSAADQFTRDTWIDYLHRAMPKWKTSDTHAE